MTQSESDKWLDRLNRLNAYGQTLSLMVYVQNPNDPRTMVDDEKLEQRDEFEAAQNWQAIYQQGLELLSMVEAVALEYGAPVDVVKKFFYPNGGPDEDNPGAP